jgi:hypothetical protein
MLGSWQLHKLRLAEGLLSLFIMHLNLVNLPF